MDVRCERCRAQYVFDDEQVTPSGLTVQCTNCGHLFKVKKKELVVTVPVKPEELEGVPLPATAVAPKPPGAAAPPPSSPAPPSAPAEPPREWRVRQANGNTFTFRELTTLQKWIIEQKVSRDDEISLAGEQWKRLGNIAELASFFQVVEAAERGKTAGGPALTPIPISGVYGVALQAPVFPPPYGAASPYAPQHALAAALEPTPTVEVDLGADDLVVKKGGRAGWLVLLVLVAVGAAAWVLVPRFLPRAAEEPTPAVAVPITIAVPAQAPSQEPAAPAEPLPAPVPVPAPEPVAEQAVEPPPEQIAAAKPPPAPPAPRGPKALLAQAGRLRDRGEIEKALDLYGEVSSADPENVAALVGRGLCYLEMEKYPPAAASFEAALGLRADDAEALLGLAETYRWQGKKADAIRYYERYLAAHPDGEEAAVARNALEELRKQP
jgi:predicted Zn finger-like uncharacterized protein